MSRKSRMSMLGLAGALLGLTALSGCHNEYYCEGRNPLNSCLVEMQMGCESQADCTEAGKNVCDLDGARTCVQCTATMSEACTGDTPVCGGTSCRGCTADAECGGDGVCLPSGACTTADQVAFVAQLGTDNPTCTKAAPCTAISSALAVARPFIHVTGTIDDAGVVDGRSVSLFGASNARLTHSAGTGAVLEVRGNSQLALYHLEIYQAAGDGIVVDGAARLTMTASKITESAGVGLRMNGGELALHRSTIQGNRGGGLSLLDTKFQIVNTFIVSNGGPTSNIGGATFAQIGTGVAGNLFELNTVAKNAVSGSAIPAGVRCLGLAAPMKLSGNIVYGNSQLDNGLEGAQVTSDASCTWSHSNIGPMGVSGATNLSTDPVFVDFAGGNLHLGPASPARDKADPASAVKIDFDGDARPQGAAPDIGADELRQ